MIVLTVVLAGFTILSLVLAVSYRNSYLREQDGRLAIHRARILDNDQRAVDNERWAERVEQARQAGKEAMDLVAVLEGKRIAGAIGETAAEHIRNALAVLMAEANDGWDLTRYGVGVDGVVLERADYIAIKSRLWTAVNNLERI